MRARFAQDYRLLVKLTWRTRDDPQWVSGFIDVLIALAVSLLVQLSVWTGSEPDETFANRPLTSAIFALVTMSLVWRRRAPLAVASVTGLGVLAQAVLTDTFAQSGALALCLGVVLYSLGAHASLRRGIGGGLLLVAVLMLKGVLVQPSTSDDTRFVALFWWLLVLSVVGLGALVRAVRRSSDLQRQARELEEERAAQVRAVAVEERQRIARELHDVVSHNVSASILQAGAARELLLSDPERADKALRSVQDMGREAIGEMRRMLGIMRTDDGSSSAPQPRLSEIPALVARADELGPPTELVVEGTPSAMPPGIELSAYRIVQEALTNVRKHADATRVLVTLRHGGSWVEVQVDDDGRGMSDAGENGTGHGLVGMRERVALFGGELVAGPREGGGSTVRARFPVATDAS